MTRRFLISTFAVLALLLAACGQKAAPEKRYPMQGVIKSLDAKTHTANIDAGKIGDWMEAMTMEYSIKPQAEFDRLHVGDKIEATVVVSDASYYVTGISVKP
jgi:Cu/Ag efflux protein CusF